MTIKHERKKKSDDEKELEVISEKAEYIREEQQHSGYFSTPEQLLLYVFLHRKAKIKEHSNTT